MAGGEHVTRAELLRLLADLVDTTDPGHPTRVAIDGPDAAGKTTLAGELAAALRDRGREVLQASIDGFHRPRTERYARGEGSPLGYYADSFDHEALRSLLLEPLGPGGSRAVRTAVFDFRADEPVDTPPLDVGRRAVLVFDGVFLLRPELQELWDVRVFVAASFEETLRRALARDVELFGSAEAVERRYRARYIPGQRLYFAEARPERHADVVVLNDRPEAPRLTVRRAPRQRAPSGSSPVIS